MKRMTLLLVLVLCLILAGCGISQKEFNEAKEQAYADGWDACLHEGDISEFNRYQHGELMEYFMDFCLDEFLSDYNDVIMDQLEMKYPEAVLATAARIMEEVPPKDIAYVANKNTMKFHKPDCGSVNDIDKANRLDWEGDRQSLIDKGYEPCKRCNP